MRLIGDIGGTNARLARSSVRGEYRDERKLPVADHRGLIEAARAYLADGPPVTEAVIAVAAPVRGDVVQFTNSPWRFSIREMKQALGLSRLAVVNDFIAQSEAITALGAEDLRELKAGALRRDRPMVVIGPGTGLGAAFILLDGANRRIVPTEVGHTSFAPQNEVQTEMLARLRQRYGHVSIERLLSGPGMLSTARLLAEMRGEKLDIDDPRDVSARAADGSSRSCQEAVHVFSSILGAVAGDLALTVLADGGVFITGGLCRGIGPLLNVEELARAFTAKGRFSNFLEGIRIEQVLRPHTGLLGAAVYRYPEGGDWNEDHHDPDPQCRNRRRL